MVWPFSSKQTPSGSEESFFKSHNENIFESIDTNLIDFYKEAEPIKPISLAPQDVKERYSKEREARSLGFERAPMAFDKGEINSLRRKFADSGGDYIQTLWEAANENCALLAARYGECQRHGPMWSVMMSCHKESEAHKKCLHLQKYALTKVGFNNALDTQQRNEIKYKLDDLYTQHFPDGTVPESAKQAFLQDVEDLKNKVKDKTYRL
ncbi:uncharacterized protein SAPINGB_P001757 [Magnusiomyces paraingens]|uniref:COX assembly mitochondrial protein n=1 Tax=Magnusiomyces paraingens TaxID=2606893 RepID=A0A5E8BCH5_9ASCO|nr:uncharacterized protein SAPINGB_P001757 [Saprochaete ingens]VVT48394.1 unnamed protein product [Saprochaete ingens]